MKCRFKANLQMPHPLFEQAHKDWDQGRLKKAYELFLHAAHENDPWSQNSVGYFLDHGIGVKKDSKQALLWYKKAARNNDICAIANLGICYRDKGNYRRARYWLLKAYQLGDRDSAVDLAKLYLAKPSSLAKSTAKKYLRAASRAKYIADSSREEAQEILKKLQFEHPED